MKLLDYFSQFLRETVNINQSRLDDLDTRVDRITEALKGAANLDGRVLDTVPQGSWAHETIIRPAGGLEFDADVLLQLAEDTGWIGEPRQYANAVWTASSGHVTYGSMSSKKDRCVRVTYANDCHIDVVPFVILSDGREVIVNRTTDDFEDTNPVGFTEWLQEKDDLAGGNLRKVIRLLKYSPGRPGGLPHQVRAAHDARRQRRRVVAHVDPKYYIDVPTALVHVVADLDSWLQMRPLRPSICDPSCPTTSFDHRWTDDQYTAFRTRIHNLAPKLLAAYNNETVAGSILGWRGAFGDRFPNALASAVAVARRRRGGQRPDTVATTPGPRPPEEQFIEEMYPVDERYQIRIVCEVSEPSYPNRAARPAVRCAAEEGASRSSGSCCSRWSTRTCRARSRPSGRFVTGARKLQISASLRGEIRPTWGHSCAQRARSTPATTTLSATSSRTACASPGRTRESSSTDVCSREFPVGSSVLSSSETLTGIVLADAVVRPWRTMTRFGWRSAGTDATPARVVQPVRQCPSGESRARLRGLQDRRRNGSHRRSPPRRHPRRARAPTTCSKAGGYLLVVTAPRSMFPQRARRPGQTTCRPKTYVRLR